MRNGLFIATLNLHVLHPSLSFASFVPRYRIYPDARRFRAPQGRQTLRETPSKEGEAVFLARLSPRVLRRFLLCVATAAVCLHFHSGGVCGAVHRIVVFPLFLHPGGPNGPDVHGQRLWKGHFGLLPEGHGTRRREREHTGTGRLGQCMLAWCWVGICRFPVWGSPFAGMGHEFVAEDIRIRNTVPVLRELFIWDLEGTLL